MSYEKTIWADGDVITAQKLNNIEEGVGKAEFEVFMTAQMNVTPGYKECISCQYPSDFAGTPDECLGKFVKIVTNSSTGEYDYSTYTQIVEFYRVYQDDIGIICANGDTFEYSPTGTTPGFKYITNSAMQTYAAKIIYTIENGVKTISDTEIHVKNNSHAGHLIGKPTIEEYDDMNKNKVNITTSRIVSVESQFDMDDLFMTQEYIKSFTTSTGTVYTWDKTASKFVATFAS